MSGAKRDLRADHPSGEIMRRLWNYYTEYVDILVKIVYKPAVENQVMTASRDANTITDSIEPLLFAVWFASVTAMSAEECMQLHGEPRGTLLHRYRRALEQALSQAGWMITQELVALKL